MRIDIPRMLLHLRGHVVERIRAPGSFAQALGVRLAAWVMASPGRFAFAGRLAYLAQLILGGGRGRWLRRLPGPMGVWARSRELPPLAPRSLRRLVSREQ